MSIFSDTLRELIEKKKIKVYPMSRYCGVERSTIYKFVSGRREPADREMLDKMAGFMQLTPAEYQELYKAWKIVRMGETTYYIRKSVEDFICHFPDRPAAPQVDLASFAPEKGLSSGRGCIALSSPQAVDQYVSQMIMAEFHRQKGEIGLLMQTDYTYLFRLLASLKPAGETEISHIVCLENKEDLQKDRKYNILACLYEMLPLYMNDLDYCPFFFYDSVESHYHNLSIFPCLVLTAEAVLLCSADFQSGLFFQEEPAVSLFWDRFRECRDQCMPLLLSSVVTPANYFSALQVTNSEDEAVTSMIALEPESCMQPFISWELLQEAVDRELPEAELIVRAAWNTFQLNSRRLSEEKLLVYFTEEGILHFARTGLIEEIPEAFYHPLSVRRRIEILEQLLECCRQGTYRMLRKPLNHLSENLHLCVWEPDRGGISFHSNLGSLYMVFPCEPGLLNAFWDYLGNMDESLYSTAEESAGRVQAVIDELEGSAGV